MDDSVGISIGIGVGLVCVIKFRQLGKFAYEQSEGLPNPLPKKWNMLLAQAMFLIVGIILIIGSVRNLISLLAL